MNKQIAVLANASPMTLLQGDLQIVAGNFAEAQKRLEAATGGRHTWLDAPVALAKERAAEVIPGQPLFNTQKRFADKGEAAAVAVRLAVAGKSFEFKTDGDGVVVSVAAADAAALEERAAPVFAVIQEGGSRDELYVHSHSTEDDAEEDRYSCADDGAYRTSQVVEIPPALAALGEVFYEAAESLLKASADLECAERPSLGMR